MSIVQTTDCSGKLVSYYRPWFRFRVRNCQNPNNVTQEQLDMRRKTEILTYKQKRNGFSKAEKYSLASRNAYTRKKSWATQNQIPSQTNPNTSNLPRVGNTLVCNNFFKTTGWTYESDVPGKAMLLNINKNIPLTMYPYASPQRTFRAGSERWPDFGWKVGDPGFPRGKKGNKS